MQFVIAIMPADRFDHRHLHRHHECGRKLRMRAVKLIIREKRLSGGKDPLI